MRDILKSTVDSLRAIGVSVPEGCDEGTAIRLLSEALAASKQSGRDLGDVDRWTARLQELLLGGPAARPGLQGSRAWADQRRRENHQAEIRAAEDALVESLQEAYVGFVMFSGARAARPHGAALLELARELRVREARGELPEPTIGRS